jgi:hypothetical protein
LLFLKDLAEAVGVDYSVSLANRYFDMCDIDDRGYLLEEDFVLLVSRATAHPRRVGCMDLTQSLRVIEVTAKTHEKHIIQGRKRESAEKSRESTEKSRESAERSRENTKHTESPAAPVEAASTVVSTSTSATTTTATTSDATRSARAVDGASVDGATSSMTEEELVALADAKEYQPIFSKDKVTYSEAHFTHAEQRILDIAVAPLRK